MKRAYTIATFDETSLVPWIELKQKRNCPACAGPTEHELLFEKAGSRIYRCSACGLGSAEASNFRPEEYYTGSYFSGGHSDGYLDYAGSESIIRREFRKVVALLNEYLPDGGRLLEIGSAYGFFLLEAKQKFEVHGIELAEDAVAASHYAGLDTVRHGMANAQTLSEIGPVDAVVMLDVLEHLPEPTETLELCAKVLEPGGLILITTGDFGSLLSRISGRSWRLMTPPQHLWFFTEKSLRKVAESLGLEFVSVTRPWKMVPLSLVLFQLARGLGLRIDPSSNSSASRIGLPVNLFDAMRIVMRRPAH